jgi:hypothetical protein
MYHFPSLLFLFYHCPFSLPRFASQKEQLFRMIASAALYYSVRMLDETDTETYSSHARYGRIDLLPIHGKNPL